MRKLTFLTMILALFASASAYAQNLTGTVSCPTPTPVDVTCLGADALHPVAGTPYTYKVDVSFPDNATPTTQYHWIVTQDQTFINNGEFNATVEDGNGTGNYVLEAGTGYNEGTNTSDEIQITWKSYEYDPAQPLFVVIKATAQTDAGCTTNNLKVYKIEPKDAFTLDIANIETSDDGAGNYVAGTVTKTNVTSCISDVASATYNVASSTITYDYGTDHLFFAVTAANFSTSWKPTFKLTGLNVGEEATVKYKRKDDPTWESTTVSGTEFYVGETVNAATASGTVGTAGECILVRVTVDHNKVETLLDQTISLAVNGVTRVGTSSEVEDIHHETSNCTEDGFENDVANHILKARPTVNSKTKLNDGTTDGNFLQPQP